MLPMRRFTYIGKVHEHYYCCFNPKRKEERRLKINGWKHRIKLPDDGGREAIDRYDECRTKECNTDSVCI